MTEQDEVQGARNTAAETVCVIRRDCEYRSTRQFARVGI